MKIGIDIQSTLKNPTGIGQYTLGLLKGLQKIDKDNQYYLYCRKSLFSKHKKLPQIPSSNFKIINDRFKKGVTKVMSDIDVFFSPSTDLPVIEGIPLVVNVNDLRFKAYPKFYNKAHIEYKDRQIKKVLKTAPSITCVSNNTKKDLIKFYPDYEITSKVEVVYPGFDNGIFNTERKSEHIPEILTRYNITIPYILSVATISKMKNTSSLLKAFYNFKKETDLPHLLVLAGAISNDYSKEELLNDAEVEESILDSVTFTGYESGDNLALLYKQADMFVFPSLYEGFGIPLVEAFACGVPVITSKTSSCGEIAGNSALTIDPENISALTEAIIDMAIDDVLRKRLSEKSIERSKEFSCIKTAEKMLNVFESVYRDR